MGGSIVTDASSTLLGHLTLLPPRQAEVLAFVERYYDAVGEGCPASVVARKLNKHPETIRDYYFPVLHRKGWLKGGSSPAVPASDRDRSLNIR